MDDLLLPGTIPGLLRLCSPVRRLNYGDLTPQESSCILRIGPDARYDIGAPGVLAWIPGALLALDLTDATGRAHAARWLAGEPGVSWGLDCEGHRRWELRGGEQPRRVVCRAWEGIGPEARSLRGEPIPDYADAADCPALDDLDPDDDRRLADGSRWVDAVALARVCRHVARERGFDV